MSTQLKLRRGTTAQHSTFTGANGEITIDTDKKTVVVHDGTTAGGRALPQFDSSGNLPIPTGTANGVAYLNGSKVLTSGSALTFDGTDLNVTGGITATGTVTLPSTTSIGDVSATELQYLNSVTSNVQDQINAKAPIDNPTFTGTVSLSTDGITFADASTQSTVGHTGFRNRIINGDMRIDQRNAGAAQVGVSSGAYICDRFPFVTSQNGKWSLQQLSISDLTGFTKSAYVTISTPYTTGATDYAVVDHKIEGFNTADFAWGTANAQPVTLSFRVLTNVTGTYGVTVLNSGATRGYCTTYTVSTSGVWTTATITIPGDTTGTWATDNSTGIWLRFGLGSGSTYTFPAVNTWSSSFGYQPSGGAVISGNTGGYWQITGVQLEKGSVATPFELRQYGTELALCQRYYEASAVLLSVVARNATGVWQGDGGAALIFKIPKRVAPTVTQTLSGSIDNCSGVLALGLTTVSGMGVSLTIGNTSYAYATAIVNYTASAEL